MKRQGARGGEDVGKIKKMGEMEQYFSTSLGISP